jgi:phage terminase large subunit
MTDFLLNIFTAKARSEIAKRNPELTDRQRLEGYADPCDFAREILGLKLTPDQARILKAVAVSPRTAVCSGQKIGKTTLFAVTALWLYCSGWRVFLTAPTEKQLELALWREVRRLRSRATIKIPGEMNQSSRGGLHDVETQAHIVGLLGRQVEALQGMSGAKMAFLVDEAAGVTDELIEAMKGNLVGGGKLLMAGNPNRIKGEFFDAFYSKREVYQTFEISSLDVPQKPEGGAEIPGLADARECEKMRLEYGEDSPFYMVRVLGKFVIEQEGRVLPIELIEKCHRLWEENDEPTNEHTLIFGVDPSAGLDDGDRCGIAVRRGTRILAVQAIRRLVPEAVCGFLDTLIDQYSRQGDRIVVVVDASGIGARVYQYARVHFENRAYIKAFRGEQDDNRDRKIYYHNRSAAYANMRELAKTERLELPPDAELDVELNAAKFEPRADGRLEATDKRDLRKELGHSPDKADAVMLAYWWFDKGAPAGEERIETSHNPLFDGPEYGTGGTLDEQDPLAWLYK